VLTDQHGGPGFFTVLWLVTTGILVAIVYALSSLIPRVLKRKEKGMIG